MASKKPVEHGLREYRRSGCHCAICLAANRRYHSERRARLRGLEDSSSGTPPTGMLSQQPAPVTMLPVKPVEPEPPAEPGPTEAATLVEIESLMGSAKRPSLVAASLQLARDLDNAKLAVSHPSLARQLRQNMDALHAASVGGGKRLAAVASMSRTSPSAGVAG